MNKTELKLMRKLLFFSVAEAAEDIGGVSARAWQRWEKGDRPLPEDVAQKMCWYLEFYTACLDSYEEEVINQIESNGIAYIPLSPEESDGGDLSEVAIKNIHEAVIASLKNDFLSELEIVSGSN